MSFLFTLACGVIGGASPAFAQHLTPYVPASGDVVLEHVPPRTDPRVRRFDALRTDSEAHPGNLQKAVDLARAYIDFGRSTGDARYLGRAMAVIDPFMRVATPPVPAMLAHATIMQSRHAFKDSRDELERILQRDPDNVQAWLTLATVAMVQGDYPAANRACVHLANAGGDFMGLMCTSSLRSLDGHASQAYTLLTLVEDPGPKAPPEIRAWIQGLMADTAARMDKPQLADTHFRNALQWMPGDNFLLADYGEFLLDQGRAQEALDLVGSDTLSDTSYLVRVNAEAMLGSAGLAADIAIMDARFAAMEQRGDHLFLREQATYLLHVHHDAAGALALSQRNWAIQRAPKDARVYLEAALAAKSPSSAQPVVDFLATAGMPDAILAGLVAKVRAAMPDAPPANESPR